MNRTGTVTTRALDSVFRTLVIALATYGALDIARGALAQDEPLYLPHIANAAEIETLSERVAALEDLLVHVTREGNDVFVTGANLHVVNGEGKTDTVNGLGNVIVGYNEVRTGEDASDDRSGSHMLVVGRWNNYSSYGGVIAGAYNSTAGAFASISGGLGNESLGSYSSVSGGRLNYASGDHSSVSGGIANQASGDGASASGGLNGEARGHCSSISGGWGGLASGRYASVSAGESNHASGTQASMSGGRGNTASGYSSSIGGGLDRQVTRECNWRAGDLFQEN